MSKQFRYKEWLFVEVPEYYYEDSLEIDDEPDENGNQWLCVRMPDGFNEKSDCQKIPQGQYSIIGKADELTEEQWREIVDKQGGKLR